MSISAITCWLTCDAEPCKASTKLVASACLTVCAMTVSRRCTACAGSVLSHVTGMLGVQRQQQHGHAGLLGCTGAGQGCGRGQAEAGRFAGQPFHLHGSRIAAASPAGTLNRRSAFLPTTGLLLAAALTGWLGLSPIVSCREHGRMPVEQPCIHSLPCA